MLSTLFFSRLRDSDPAALAAYTRHAAEMNARVATGFPGFVSTKTFVAEDGERLTVVRFEDAKSQRAWAEDPEHQRTQQKGVEEYYGEYRVTVAQELRTSEWKLEEPGAGHGTRSPEAVSDEAASSELFPETLDPENWEEFRALAQKMLDRMIDWQRDVRLEAAWRPLPAAIDERFRSPVPRAGVGSKATCDDFLELVLPYPTGLAHPRWWGWAGGTGSPMGMLAAMVGSATNSVPGNFDDAASRVEEQLLDWMKEALGFPMEAGGIVTSGGSVANLLGLTVARDQAVETLGAFEHSVGEHKLVLYASKEVHSSVFKTAQLLGLGRAAVRLIDDEFRVRVPEMRAALERDRGDGYHPFAIVGTAGTINTGSMDDLDALADLAEEEGVWFHVDGAFGAMAALAPETRDLVAGMGRADSLAFDFHKWMYVNYEAGCVLIRDPEAHKRSFTVGGDYLKPLTRGAGSRADMAGGRGLQLSRGFKALKPWMTIKEQGMDQFGRLVAQNVAQACYLAGLIDASAAFVRVAPVALNVVAFRYDDAGHTGAELDEINREILMRIHERGIAIPSSTVLHGRVALRTCICNHRSRQHDFDEFVEGLEAIAREILNEERQPALSRCED